MDEFKVTEKFDDLDQESKYLVHKAKDAATHAHASYSKFMVGAALILEDGTLVTGGNYENAAYPSGMCAERVALYSATANFPDKRILKIAIVAKRKASKDLSPAPPCGGCRQVMLEFEVNQKKSIQIVMQEETGRWITAPSAASLLPYCFKRENLDTHHK